METFTSVYFWVLGIVWFLIFGGFACVSHSEGEKRARGIAGVLALVGAALFALAGLLPYTLRLPILVSLHLAGFAALILCWLPIGRIETGHQTPTRRFDERKIMFARARLQPGTPEYETYYTLHPEHEKSDLRTRSQPGLLAPDAKFANPYQFASTTGSFELTGALWDAVDGPVADEQLTLSQDQAADFIQGLAHYFGALDVGFTKLKPYHVYSHIGRGTGTYGEPIPLDHTHAVAFTVEMDFEMVGSAPQAAISMESARQYVEAARVALQLANTLRRLGYSARAHIDGNYRVIAPLVARDAGLGDIGRITLLMTPKEGPRVRLGVVTTDLELPVTASGTNTAALIDFCTICKKCAENCPSRSIPFTDREEIDGALRWKLEEETCFRYWAAVGTDCGRCMAVCPFAHPDNLAHNVIRWGINRSGAFRRFALWMDDLFYGKKPACRPAPEWTRVD